MLVIDIKKKLQNMKTYSYIIGVILLAITAWSCEREFEAPPLFEPEYTGPEANITIAKLKSLYNNISDPTLIDVDYIVRAYVSGNDESGNIYKQLYIQDETGGINLGVDQNSVYTDFRVGQEVYVAVKGLYMVKYGNQLQIGFDKTNANRISWEVFNYHISKKGWPDADNVEPKVVKLSELDQSIANTLIQLDGVYFTDGGKLPFSEPEVTVNRTLKDADGNSIIVRNSGYATFANDILPEGAGTVVGILSKFNNDWQLYLRTVDDIINFGQPLPPGAEQGNGGNEDPNPPTGDVIFSEKFDANQGSFTIENVVLPEGSSFVWSWDSYGYMKASSFVGGSAKASESWLISPAIDLSKSTSANVKFEHAVNFAGTMTADQTLMISSNYSSGAPSTATWTKLTIPNYPAGNNWSFSPSGTIAIPGDFVGKSNVHVAFKYVSTTSNAATWEIKNVEVR